MSIDTTASDRGKFSWGAFIFPVIYSISMRFRWYIPLAILAIQTASIFLIRMAFPPSVEVVLRYNTEYLYPTYYFIGFRVIGLLFALYYAPPELMKMGQAVADKKQRAWNIAGIFGMCLWGAFMLLMINRSLVPEV